MRLVILAIICSLTISTAAYSQEVYSSSGKPMAQLKREKERREREERRKFSTSKLVYGGGFGFSFGNVTAIAVSPIIGYRITDKFFAGIGFGYQYLRIKEYNQLWNPDTQMDEIKPLSANMYTPSIWARYIIWNNIFAHAEYQENLLTVKEYTYYPYYPNNIIQEKTSYSQDALWVGGGLRQPISDKVSFIVMGLYNVLPDTRNILGNRLDIRFGINAGF